MPGWQNTSEQFVSIMNAFEVVSGGNEERGKAMHPTARPKASCIPTVALPVDICQKCLSQMPTTPFTASIAVPTAGSAP